MGYQECELQSDAAQQATPKIDNQRYVLGYNARLDGLRGWATLCVLFYHYFVPGFQAGIYGLDVFFVISGYLITKVLVKFIADEQSLGQFYWNRFLRLMPALAEICAVLLILSLLFPKLADPQSLQRDAVSSILYVANWTRALSLGFPSFLGNCWSLAVEEQFYLLWPLTCMFLARRGKGTLLRGTLLLACCAVAWPFWLEAHHVTYDRLANGSDTRGAGLLIGCALALIEKQPFGETLEKLLSRLAPIAFLALAALVTFSEDHWYPLFGLTSSLCAVVLIAAAYQAPLSWVGKILEISPAVILGKISYSVYLWHYPIMLLLYVHQFPKPMIAVIGLPLSLAIGFLSYKFVEQPALRLRSKPGLPLRQLGFVTVSWSFLGMVLGIALFFHDYQEYVFSSRPPILFGRSPTQ